MASEIEQPFRLSFQSDSVHSGSISFGRFETESLCWERWSSFSHNRYLEEVEKYSRPGSVTEKKAYFEAHFKRRALLSQCSSDCQTGTEHQTSENDISENTGYSEELEQTSESNHSVLQFDKSVNGSENGEESEVTNHERLDMGTSVVGTRFKPATDTCSLNLCSTSENVPETQSSSIIDGEPRKEVNEDCKYEAASVNLTHKSLDSFAKTIEDDTATLEPQDESSPQVEIKLESKPMGSKSKSLVNISASRKASSCRELPKNPVGKHTKTRIEGFGTTVNTKMSSQKAASLPTITHRTLKPEESKRSKLNDKRRSGQDLKDEKGVGSKPAAMQEVVPETRRPTNRALPSGISSRPGMRNNSIISNSECNKLPERRKEEKKEAGVKQHPKSPNLKATPRPSFSSSEAVVSAPGKNKVEPSSRLRNKSTPGVERHTTSNTKPATSGSRHQASSARNMTGVSTHSPIHPNQGEACKMSERESNGSLRKHRPTENIRGKKAPKNEGKPRQVRYVAGGVSRTGGCSAVVVVS